VITCIKTFLGVAKFGVRCLPFARAEQAALLGSISTFPEMRVAGASITAAGGWGAFDSELWELWTHVPHLIIPYNDLSARLISI